MPDPQNNSETLRASQLNYQKYSNRNNQGVSAQLSNRSHPPESGSIQRAYQEGAPRERLNLAKGLSNYNPLDKLHQLKKDPLKTGLKTAPKFIVRKIAISIFLFLLPWLILAGFFIFLVIIIVS